MAAKILGFVTCPHCGNEKATVHRNAKGRDPKLYYRCYEVPGSVVWNCGTVQISGPKGQAWIKSTMRPIEQDEPQQAKGYEPPKPEPQQAKGSEDQQKTGTFGGMFANFWKDEDE